MLPSSLPAAMVPWLAGSWIATVVVVSALIYLIVRAVLGKTDPQKLPEVLSSLTPLLHGIVRALSKLPTSLTSNEKPSGVPIMQNGDTSPELPEETP